MKPPSSPSLALFHNDSQQPSSSSSGCIFSVLRRILCSTAFPSDHTLEASSSCCHSAAQDDNNKAVPGLVARLMGLESIPERITRSRSLNAVDHIKPQADEDVHQRKKLMHMRSKSTLSFRDTPTYIELDDDEFIVLKFDNKRRPNKEETTSAETREKEEKQQHKSCQVGSLLQPSEIESCRLVKKTTLSSDSDESSPVSVFDFQEPNSEDDSWTRSTGSSRMSSPEQDNTKISAEQVDDHKNTEEETVVCGKEEHIHKASALLNNTVVLDNGQKKRCGIMCTDAEIKGTVNSDRCVEDLAAEMEVHIMDKLLNDLLLLLLSFNISI